MAKHAYWMTLLSASTLMGCVEEMSLLATNEPADSELVGATEHEVVNGTTTSARPEVGSIGGCTATLITARHFVTAAHCINYAAESTGGTFTIGTNTYNIDRIMAFHNGLGKFDVAIGRLAAPVPASVATPARIANVLPATGTTATVMGYGCNDRDPVTGAGVKRYATFSWGSATSRLCYGDSGGPVFVGALNDNGPMIGINSGHTGGYGNESGTDYFGDPTYFKQRIEQTIRTWEGDIEIGIDRPGHDYRSLSTTTTGACRTECTNDSACRAFTYVHSTSMCWLKNAVPDAYPNPNTNSGLPATIGTLNRDGNNYSSYASPSAESCAADCARSGAQSPAFTYVTSTGICWLKNGVPSATPCSTCQSGNRRGLEINVNRGGSDYSSVTTTTASACADTCAREDRCVAFSWVASTSTCWLKDEVPPASAATGVTSGVRRGWEINTNRAGSDLSDFFISGPQPELCQAACARTTGCVAWTMTSGPSFRQESRCWLKNGIPGKSYAAGMISGLKGMEFF